MRAVQRWAGSVPPWRAASESVGWWVRLASNPVHDVTAADLHAVEECFRPDELRCEYREAGDDECDARAGDDKHYHPHHNEC